MKKLLLFIMMILINIPGNGICQTKSVLVTAHRGASGYAPENTVASMKEAINMKADYAELDVQETSDGVVILLHDKTLEKTTGLSKNIWEASYDEIKDLDAGSWFDEKYKNERIPKFSDLIPVVRGKIKLNIELKSTGHEQQLVDKTVKMVKDSAFEKECFFTSFNYDMIKRVKEIDPSLKCGYIFKTIPSNMDVFKADCELLSVHFSVVDEEFMSKAKAGNKEVHVWTVNEEDEMNRLIKLGVTSLITNYPDKVRAITGN